MDLTKYIRDVPDFPKKGIVFKDITPLLNEVPAFRWVIQQLADRYRTANIAKVVGIESRGFIFGAALAYELGAGFVPVRKAGKLPSECIQETYELEYGSATAEIHADAIHKGERVVVVDDLIATGGTLAAACRLAERLGAEIVEIAVVIELSFLSGRSQIAGRPFHTFLKY